MRYAAKRALDRLTGRASFEVDEEFVFAHVENEMDDGDREMLGLFIGQSREARAEEDAAGVNGESTAGEQGDGVEVEGAYYRICDIPPRQCDDSPLEDVAHPERITCKKRTVWGHTGRLVSTDGGKGSRTKLTKVYKRDDNCGALLSALRRMKLNF